MCAHAEGDFERKAAVHPPREDGLADGGEKFAAYVRSDKSRMCESLPDPKVERKAAVCLESGEMASCGEAKGTVLYMEDSALMWASPIEDPDRKA